MKRRTAHQVFALISAFYLSAAGVHGWNLYQLTHLNSEVARIAAAPVDADTPAPALTLARELQLVSALTLSQAGFHDAALKGYAGLMRAGERDALAQQALYNLGNMYLRQGVEQGERGVPLLELGKQRMRDLLRVAPDNWDARYNLERALRLAPEREEDFSAEQNLPTDRVKVRVPGFVVGDLP